MSIPPVLDEPPPPPPPSRLPPPSRHDHHDGEHDQAALPVGIGSPPRPARRPPVLARWSRRSSLRVPGFHFMVASLTPSAYFGWGSALVQS